MLEQYHGKKVLITGDTGFKGSWLSLILYMSGAEVTGYGLNPPTTPALYDLLCLNNYIEHIDGDIRDREKLQKVLREKQPEIIFHLAAQPIVQYSYQEPAYTYETNVMGTVNLLESVRHTPSVKSVLNITTDKVYRNREWEWGYRENEELDGFDPYSNSKSCSELVTHSYKASFFDQSDVCVSTARAGNVIGGGDFAPNRIIPDCFRAAELNKNIILRNPHSIRPYQHVLEPLSAYLHIVLAQMEDQDKQDYYNVGPDEINCVTTGKIAELFCHYWGKDLTWITKSDHSKHEANFLKLDCSKIKHRLGWHPRWRIEESIKKTVAWYQYYLTGGNLLKYTERQIQDFFEKYK
ncbi:MAG: CDP-glucose 4,6-dehydratase [Lachnospiraceae bacterium]|nr:CDP-glucose 4,6-dehydratase [Lachnospiraceae bacterium]